MKYDDLLDLVKERRSIRRFKADPVPDDYIEKIIEVARWAPSGYNQQPWEFVVVKEAELRKKIGELIGEYFRQQKVMEATRETWQGVWKPESVGSADDFTMAPVFIILFGDIRTKAGLPMALRHDPCRFQLNFTSSLANAFLYMHLAATTLGLASQWISGVRIPYAHCLLKNILGIPSDLEVFDMIALGYPAVKPRPKLMRDKQKMIHYDYCGVDKFRTDEEVNDFIRRSRSWIMATHNRKADK